MKLHIALMFLVQCSITFVRVQGHFHSDHVAWGYFGPKEDGKV